MIQFNNYKINLWLKTFVPPPPKKTLDNSI